MRGIFHWIMKIERVIGRRNESLMTLIFCLFLSCLSWISYFFTVCMTTYFSLVDHPIFIKIIHHKTFPLNVHLCSHPSYFAEHSLIIIYIHIFLCTFISILITPFSPRLPWNENISTVLSFALSWLLLLAVLWERSLPIFLPDHDPTRILWKKASPLLPLCPLRVKTGGLVFRRRAHGLQEMLP